MLRDLRNLFKKTAIKVNPSDCRNNDMHLLLSDYLYKELKTEGINVKRNSVNLNVSFKDGSFLVVDCLDGHIYMNTGDSNKPIGKLRRFEMRRAGEAYDCAVQNARRIINKIKSIQNEINNDNVIFKSASLKDMRKVSVRDMRKQASINDMGVKKNLVDMRKLATDIQDREKAILYINGQVLEGRTHSECVNAYLNGKAELNNTFKRPTFKQYDGLTSEELNEMADGAFSERQKQEYQDAAVVKDNVDSMAFAHLIDDNTIYLETDSLSNCNLDQVLQAIKQAYPNHDIYDDIRDDQKLAKINIRDLRRNPKMKDMRKMASIKDLRKVADIVGDRECAIVVINGSEILEGNTHAEAINNYLTRHGAEGLNEKYYRVQTYDLETPVDSLEQRLDGASDSMKNSIEDAITIQENITALAFAHKMKDYTIRLETDTLWNCTVNSIAYLLKDNYRDYDILDDCSMEERKIARIRDLRRKITAVADFRQEKLIYRKDMRR